VLLPIPVDRCTNKIAVEDYNKRETAKSESDKKKEQQSGSAEDPVYPCVPLSECIARWAAEEQIDDWYSPAIKGKTIALKQKRFEEFPKYLVLQMGRFVVKGFQLSKLDADIQVPDELDLEYLRGNGLQPNEKEFPADEVMVVKLNEDIISALMNMGFPRNHCEHAAFNTQGQDAQAAMDWLFARMDDPSLNQPLQLQKPAPSKTGASINESSIEQLLGMGFPRERCIKALQSTENNVERALDWLFSHADDPLEDSPQPTSQVSAPQQNKAPGHYKLLGFITHMGKSTESGHYVAHINVDGKWIIYNDLKVAESRNPPREMAYLYFYTRVG